MVSSDSGESFSASSVSVCVTTRMSLTGSDPEDRGHSVIVSSTVTFPPVLSNSEVGT